MSTRSGWKPRSMRWSSTKLRISRPAPTTRTTERATSETTRARRSGSRPRPAVAPLPPSRSEPASGERARRSAGARPKRTPVRSASAALNPSTRPSSPASSIRGMLAGSRAASPSRPRTASATPRTPPAAESRRLSMRSCRKIRVRPAPSAVRIATSRRLPSARARRRLATLAQAISSTNPTAPKRTSSAGRTSPNTSSRTGTAARRNRPSPSSFRWPSRNQPSSTRSRSAVAAVGAGPLAKPPEAEEVPVAPAAQVAARPGRAASRAPRDARSGSRAGGGTPGASPRPPCACARRPGSRGRPPPGSPPKRRCQRAWESTATASARERVLRHRAPAPGAGGTPRTAKAFSSTRAAGTRSGSVPPGEVHVAVGVAGDLLEEARATRGTRAPPARESQVVAPSPWSAQIIATASGRA